MLWFGAIGLDLSAADEAAIAVFVPDYRRDTRTRNRRLTLTAITSPAVPSHDSRTPPSVSPCLGMNAWLPCLRTADNATKIIVGSVAAPS